MEDDKCFHTREYVIRGLAVIRSLLSVCTDRKGLKCGDAGEGRGSGKAECRALQAVLTRQVREDWTTSSSAGVVTVCLLVGLLLFSRITHIIVASH